MLFDFWWVQAEDMLLNKKYGDSQRVKKLKSALLLVVEKKASLMSLSEFCVVCFLILEYGHFFLVYFDLENTAITVIDNMAIEESPIHLINDNGFFNKTTPYKVKDVFTKYRKLVNHPKYRQIEKAVPQRLDFEWKTVGNTVDCWVFVMRHMKTWFGVTVDKWDSGFPLEPSPKKTTLTWLREKYTVKLVTSSANKHRDRILGEA
ncbi:hypothetical protein HanLR1_Chr06g0208041 [Helianthus annuus]|nr:hypothetical protein HanLR1_Chr06g0208041 [Helianthus annuus]